MKELFDALVADMSPEDQALYHSLSEKELAVAFRLLDGIDKGVPGASEDLLYDIDYWVKPVTIQQFIEDEYFSGEIGKHLFPTWVDELHDVFSPTSRTLEWILTGSIGGGKTHAGTFGIWYKLYQLCCMRNPHQAFGLTPGSEIVFGFYTRTRELNASQGYRSLKQWIKVSPFFREHYLRIKGQKEVIELPNSIVIHSGSQMAHALGQNLFAYEIDEMNFMQQASEELPGEDDGQAFELYDGTMRRLKSRYMKAGVIPGLVVLISSKRATSDFLEEHKKTKRIDPFAHVSDFALYDAKPRDQYSKDTFQVDCGDAYHSARIIEPGDPTRVHADIIDIPMDFMTDFERNITKSLRDIAGRATDAITPLIPRKEAVYECIDIKRKNPFTVNAVRISTETSSHIDKYFDLRSMCRISRSAWLPKFNPHTPRYVHVDLARTGCSAGIAMGHISKYTWIEETDLEGTKTRVLKPEIYIDLMIELPPPKVGEIDFEKIRVFLMKLDTLGFYLYRISYDGYQSADSIQLLRKQGWGGKASERTTDVLGSATGRRKQGRFADILSVDRNDEAYIYLRNALLEGRISFPAYPIFQQEVIALEHDIQKKKVDHPPKGSKDISDCIAGVCFHCMTLKQERPAPPPRTAAEVQQYAAAAAPASSRPTPPRGVPPRWDLTTDYKERKKLVGYETSGKIIVDPNIKD